MTNASCPHHREILRRHLTAVSAPSAVSAACVFAAIAASVAGVAAPVAAFSLDRPAVSPSVDDPCPAFAGVSADPGSAARLDFPVPSGISGPASGFLC